MLHLARNTDPQWFDRIRGDIDAVLIDHAHLEKRAASTALSMVFRYTSKLDLARSLSAVVREEMEHFELMLDLLEQRGVAFQQLDPAPYAAELVSHIRKTEPESLLDRLLVAALIEARSCERFQHLAAGVEPSDPALADFYRQLAVSEARHHTLYTGLARQYFDKDDVAARLDELAECEAQALDSSGDIPRLHSR